MDDRTFTTHFNGSVRTPGIVDILDEFKAIADYAHECGFTVVAELLMDVHSHRNFKEPKREYGWRRPWRGNGSTHFWRGPSLADGVLCNRRLYDAPHDCHWYCWHPCKRCEEILRRDYAVEYADAIEALDRFRAENEAEDKARRERREAVTI